MLPGTYFRQLFYCLISRFVSGNKLAKDEQKKKKRKKDYIFRNEWSKNPIFDNKI